MDQFNLTYSLTVQKRNKDEFVEISNPLTVDFNINKTSYKGSNTLTIKIFNLSEGTRDSLRRDPQFNLKSKQQVITFAAGYNGNNIRFFQGVVVSCTVMREGVNTVTVITAFDHGLISDIVTRRSYVKGTLKQQIIDDMINELGVAGIKRGFIEPVSGSIKRNLTVFGRTVDLLGEMTEDKFYIDNMKGNVTDFKRIFAPSVISVIDSSILLGTPALQSSLISFQTPLEAGLVIGQMLELRSKTVPYFNGQVIVQSFEHKGTISDSVKSSVTTNVVAKYKYAGLKYD